MTAAALRVARRAALALAVAALIWAAYLWLLGGFSAEILGVTVRSRNPLRPLIIAALLFAIFVRLVPDDGAMRWVRRAAGAIGRFGRAGQLQHAAAGALVLSLVIIGITNGSKAAGGSDSYGYLSQAELWLNGRLSIPQPWVKDVPWPEATRTFAPLGYVPAQEPSRFSLSAYRASYDPYSIVPTYSPGLPLLMAAAKFAGGTCAPFLVVPIAGGLLLLATYLLGLRLGSPWLGIMGAFLVATSPPFLLFHMIVMSDVPVAAALTMASWCVLGTTMRSASGAALALLVAMLIRPNLAPLALVFGLWMVLRIWRGAPRRGFHAWRAVVVLGGLAGSLLCTAAIYWTVYGSPFQSGYGPASAYFAADHIVPNIRLYTQWFAEKQTPVAFLGLAALFLPVKWLWPDVADRSVIPILGLFVAVVLGEFFYYLVGDAPEYLRFLLPCYPFIMIGVSSVALSVMRLLRHAGPLLAAVGVFVLGLHGLRDATREWYVFDQRTIEAKYIEVAEHVRSATPENSVVMTVSDSGNVRYFGGRVTLRWDLLDPEWLDRSVAWMAERGVHSYMLLFTDAEREYVKERFASQALTAALDGPPVFRFGNRLLYDLGPEPGTVVTTREIPVVDLPPRCVPPMPQPTIAWSR